MHQDANPCKEERKRIERDIPPAYAAAHAGMTVKEATESALNNPSRLMQQGWKAETVLWGLQEAGILV
ncbi:hypothetical protein IHE29_12840 [Mycetohabitans rhizoxinica]|uniref:Uncharacterized protein n=1 Tax=Mycetohabitans rhizoxinica TaxID=412963 RepID=A0ABZ2PYV2_9BURK